jgi:hypothetical protein
VGRSLGLFAKSAPYRLAELLGAHRSALAVAAAAATALAAAAATTGATPAAASVCVSKLRLRARRVSAVHSGRAKAARNASCH